MKKLTLRVVTLASFGVLTLWAADVWDAKPYTEWSAKDIQKIMTNSPWAKQVSVSFSFADAPGGGAQAAGRGGRGGGGGAPGGGGGAPDPGFGAADTAGGGGGFGGGGGGGRGGGGGGGGGGGDIGGGGFGGAPESNLEIRWQSAPTLREALAKARFGAEAGTSDDAKKAVAPEDKYYVIWISGLPGYMVARDDAAKKTLLEGTTLTAKGKDPITAQDVIFPQAGGGRGARTADADFLFPRKVAFTADDKEVEFVTKFGKKTVKAKFNLKDMVVKGQLGL